MRIWYFIDAIAILGFIFVFAFFGLAIASPETLEHAICLLRTDTEIDYATCRSAL